MFHQNMNLIDVYYHLTLFGWVFLGLLTDGGRPFWPPLPKIRHTYPAMMKVDTVIPYH